MVFLITSVWAAPAHAQAQSIIRTGSFEVGPFLGGGVNRPVVCGNLTFALNKYFLVYGEATRFVIATSESFSGTINGVMYSEVYPISSVYDFDGGFHIRLPIRESRVVPYVVLGAGIFWHPSENATETFIYPGGSLPVSIPLHEADNPSVHFGGGIRYYLNDRCGFRVEAKGYKAFNSVIFSQVFAKVEFGFFFQLR